MATVLYADVLFAIDFSMDFLSLAATASLLGCRKRPGKIAIASALGALYGVSFTVADAGGFFRAVSAIAVCAAMCIISFGYGDIRNLFTAVLITSGCGALLGGIMTVFLSQGASIPVGTIIISSFLLSFFILRAVRLKKGCTSVDVIISYQEKSVSFSALCDSGNLMRDPFAGTPVIIVSKEALTPILNESVLNSLIKWDATLPDGMIIRPIPASSCGEKYITAAFRADKVCIRNGPKELDADCFIAVSPHPKGYFASFDATVPSALIP